MCKGNTNFSAHPDFSVADLHRPARLHKQRQNQSSIYLTDSVEEERQVRDAMQFKTPLRPDDEFYSRLRLTKEGIKYIFHHDLFRAFDEKLSFRAQVELVCIVNGRLSGSEDYDRAFAPWLE